MRNRIRTTLQLIVLSCAIFVNAKDAQWNMNTPSVPKKMVWAHLCGWGFNFHENYDNCAARPEKYLTALKDRSLLGKWAFSDAGNAGNVRKTIDSAKKYGIDGFCVDIINARAYYRAMKKYYDAAEGSNFKIALCIDRFDGNVENMTRHLAQFIQKLGKHPNNSFVNGKPAIFIYNYLRGGSKKQWLEVINNLKARKLEAYYLIQPQRETSLCDNEAEISAALKTFDGLYDFGINGFPLKAMERRLLNGRKLLNKYRPGGILCGGITQGYRGTSSGYYRPYLNFETMRNNWKAIETADCDWVCLTTWNDYIENTQFEPSFWNRDTLAKINRDYVSRWRNEPLPKRGSQVYIAYQNIVKAGDDWTLEMLSMPYTEGESSFELKFTDASGGKILKQYPPVKLPHSSDLSKTYRIKNASATLPEIFRVWARTTTKGGKSKWKHLCPVRIRPGIVMQPRTVRINLNDVMDIKMQLVQYKREATAKIYNEWCVTGKVDFLLNGLNLASKEIGEISRPPHKVRAKLIDNREPHDLYLATYTNDSGLIAWSTPLLVKAQDAPSTIVELPVKVSGRSFDEDWPIWSGLKHTYKTQKQNFASPGIYNLVVPMDEGKFGAAMKTTGNWFIPLNPGGICGRSKSKADYRPAWKSGTVGSQERKYLYFDGINDRLSMPEWTMPIDTFSVELDLKPELNGRRQCVFSSGNSCINIYLTPDGKVELTRRKGVDSNELTAFTSSGKIASGSWTRISVVYDGEKLKLYIDGKLDFAKVIPPTLFRVNALPVLGGKAKNHKDGALIDCYNGAMAGFRLTTEPLNVNRIR